MKNLFSATALAAAAVLVAGAAHAQSMSSWTPSWVYGNELYVSAKAGANQLQNANLGRGFDETNDVGFTGTVAVGKYFTPTIRGEIEGGYYTNEVNKIHTPFRVGNVQGGGHTENETAMANAYYEPYANCRISPYIGAGVGAAFVKFKNVHGGNVEYADGSDTQFAGQGIVGASYKLTPHTALTAEYRYMQSLDADVGARDDANIQEHSVLAGVRYKF